MCMIGSVCPLPIAYNPFTRQPVQLLYFDPGCKTALTGIKTDGTIHEYDINQLRQLNLNHYILIDHLKSRRDKKKRGSKQWRRLNSKNTEHLRTDRWSDQALSP